MGFTSLNLNGGYLYANAIPAYNFGTNDFTVEAWVKTMTGGTIMGKKPTDGGRGNGGFLMVARPDGTIKFATDSGYGFYELNSVATAICNGVWHHVAAVRQGSTISLYFDGQPLTGTPRGNVAPPLNVSNSYRLTIGTVDQQQEPYRNLLGSVAEVRLWNRARTAAEIALNCHTRLSPGTAGLAGYWSAEQGLLADFSGNNNVAQISGKVTPSTDAPAVGSENAPTMLFLFSGAYDYAVKQGGNNGTWNSRPQLHLTSMGFVVVDNRVMNGVTITGNDITWPLQSNPYSGNLNFALNSTNPSYWPNGQTRYNFTGSIQSSNEGTANCRGVIMPIRTGCGIFLSIGTGQIFHTVNPTVGSPVTLAPKTAQLTEHYCLYDDKHILNMSTNLALAAQGGLRAGSTIVLAASDSSANTQHWVLGNNGTITATDAPNLAIAVDRTRTPYQLVLSNLNASDPNQQFATLSVPQFIFNADVNLVLSGSANYQVTVQTKATNAPYELWCVLKGCLLNGATAQALAVSGAAAPGAAITLAKFNPGDPTQKFDFEQGQLIHQASGLPVKMSVAGSGLTLGTAGETGTKLSWAIAATTPTVSRNGSGRVRRATAAQANDEVEYIVDVYTDSALLAGTDDKVEISLEGSWACSDYVELKNSAYHTNPFERGNQDRFTVRVSDIGDLVAVNVRFGADNWFFTDDWALKQIFVYDPTTITRYMSGDLCNGVTYWVPNTTRIEFASSYVIGTADSTITIGKAPSQDSSTRGNVDHTWAKVDSTDSSQSPITTYFDCGGGNNGPGTVSDIISSKCSLNTAVKMATGYYINSDHPYKSVYGHNDVNGVETCGIRASGFRGWDGQCHQMVNRLLYICNPPVALDDCPDNLKPTGYGLSMLMWGKYGVQFDQWCRLNGFPTPPDRNSSLFDYVRRYISNSDQQIEVAYAAIAMQGATTNDPQSIDGPATHTFFQQCQSYGVSNWAMAALTCLPQDKVIEEQQPYNH